MQAVPYQSLYGDTISNQYNHAFQNGCNDNYILKLHSLEVLKNNAHVTIIVMSLKYDHNNTSFNQIGLQPAQILKLKAVKNSVLLFYLYFDSFKYQNLSHLTSD